MCLVDQKCSFIYVCIEMLIEIVTFSVVQIINRNVSEMYFLEFNKIEKKEKSYDL